MFRRGRASICNRQVQGNEFGAADVVSRSAAPVGLIELLTYCLHQMPIGAGKL